jgi:hypothetical protein
MSMGALTTAALLMCAAAACVWKSEPRLGHEHAQSARHWHLCAGLLFGLSLAYALSLDTWVLKWGRGLAMDAGLYRWRRLLQALLLIGVVACGTHIVRRLRSRPASASSGPMLRSCATATAVIVVMLTMRTVSLHGVDAVVAFHVLGLSLGRWFEWTASLVVMASAVLNGRVRRARTDNPLNAWEATRV